MPIGIANTFGNPSLDLLKRGKPQDDHRTLYHGKAIDERGYHRSAEGFGDSVSATLVETQDGFALEAPEGQAHLSVKVRWDEQSGQTHLVVGNSDTNPATGREWDNQPRRGDKEHRVETSVPLPWTEKDWARVDESRLRTFGTDRPDSQAAWRDGYEPFMAIETPIVDGYNIARIEVRPPSEKKDGFLAQGYVVEIGDPSSPDKYLIHHTITHLTTDRPDLRIA